MRARRPRLSLLVNTFNEAERLPACLASARSIADEIVVVDTGSTDGTPEVAQRLGARVLHHPPVPVVEFARDFSLAACEGDWILVLDADERLQPSLCQWIEQFLSSAPSSVDAVSFPRKNWFLGDWLRGGSWWPAHQTRLIRRGVGVYGRTIHVQPLEGSRVLKTDPRPQLAIEHHAYASVGEFVTRTLGTYSEMEATLGRHQAVGPVRLGSVVLRRLLVELVWKRGYRDGMRGVIMAGLLATYEFLNKARAWEQARITVEPGERVEPQAGAAN